MVSGPLVGFGLGYALDHFLGTHPWGKIICLLIGIGAGFLNVYRDTQSLLHHLAKEEQNKPQNPGTQDGNNHPRP
ncbi:MAG: AtpZ/AtpI family protein [Desulfovibrionaceae bacterium]|nr:AtpZ/AtpI family protein [Desulfovibrionaceae bacterium]